MSQDVPSAAPFPPHPRRMGWFGASALAMGGSNQMLFILGALLIGQGAIKGQGTAAIPLLAFGLLLSCMAAPGWIELTLMWPNRVGGLAATCGEAFRPYAPVLGNLTGMCYWWGWVPTCGVTALLSASAIQQWFLPQVPVSVMATGIVLLFTAVNLCGVWWPARLAMPIAVASGTLAFLSAIIPVWTGHVDWHQATSFQLTVPFPGRFGQITSAMAGLYLVGFAAPAFEASLCHVGEMVAPERNVPRAVLASAMMATLYFLVLPTVWLGSVGSSALSGDLALALGPTFSPLLGSTAKAAAICLLMFNMFHGTLAPLTGVARTLSQLSEDGLLPNIFQKRNRYDCPWVAICFTALCAILFLLAGDPVWLIAAADFTYLIGISLPSIAVWLLRRDQPDFPRPYRAPRGTITMGLVAACCWLLSTVLGFEQFGLPTVLLGLALAYSGSVLYAWRKWRDARAAGQRGLPRSLHVKLTGAMLLVLVLDGAGYLMAVTSAQGAKPALVAGLEDIFVAVALLTITVGLVLPGMIAHAAVEVSDAAQRLATGTMRDFSRAMAALSAGDLDAAYARVDSFPVDASSRDELGEMAASFNTLQAEIARAASALGGAREGLRAARRDLTEANATLEQRVMDRTVELKALHARLVEVVWQAGMAEVATGVLHDVGNALNSLNVSASLVRDAIARSKLGGLERVATLLTEHGDDLSIFLADDPAGRTLPTYVVRLSQRLRAEQNEIAREMASLVADVEHVREIVRQQQVVARNVHVPEEEVDPVDLMEEALRINHTELRQRQVRVVRDYAPVPRMVLGKHKILQILVNLIGNACQALEAGGRSDKTLRLRLACESSDHIIFQVIDDGIGIPADSLARIFEHGFTTRTDGHGFGLHTSALAAQVLGGAIHVRSDGQGKGATFSLEIPLPRAAHDLP